AVELDVQQDDLGPEVGDGPQGLGSVRRLANYVEALRFQQHPGRRPELSVVVDDEQGRTHEAMVPRGVGPRIVASHKSWGSPTRLWLATTGFPASLWRARVYPCLSRFSLSSKTYGGSRAPPSGL